MLGQVISGRSTSPMLAAFEELGGLTGMLRNIEKGDNPSDDDIATTDPSETDRQ